MTPALSPEMQAELAKLHDIRLPGPIGWWPLAPGWWLLLALVCAAVLFVLWRDRQRRKSLRYLALQELAALRAQAEADPTLAAANPSADLDEGLLTRIADLTGARYFRATDVAGLTAIYREIDRIEPIAADPQFLRPMVALFYWPLGLALAMSALFAAALLPLRFPTFARPKESRS